MSFISDFVNSHDSLVQFGLWATVGAFTITLSLILYILAFRTLQIILAISNRHFYKYWRPVLAMCSLELPAKLPPLHGRDHLPFLSLWNHYYEVLQGEACDNLIALAQQLDLASIARCQLFRNDKKHRLLGILTLGNLRSKEDWPLLNQFLHLPDTYLSLVAMRALFQIHPDRAVKTLLPYLISRTDYPPAQVGILLNRIEHNEVCPQLILQMVLNLGLGSSHILRYMEACNCEINRQIFEAILQKQPDDHVISTALGMINDPTAIDLILPFVEHPRWHIRVHVAEALGKLARRDHIPQILRLIKDREWWVRYRAAQALAGLPFMSKEELQGLRQTLDDPYARDILRQAMAETA
jgi:HEAT repeat protein